MDIQLEAALHKLLLSPLREVTEHLLSFFLFLTGHTSRGNDLHINYHSFFYPLYLGFYYLKNAFIKGTSALLSLLSVLILLDSQSK